MRISELPANMKRNVLRSMTIEAIQYFGTIAFTLCLAFNISSSAMTALILAECAHVLYRICEQIFAANEVKNKIKRVISSAVPGAVIIIIILIVGVYIEEPTIVKIINFATKIAAFALSFSTIVPTLPDDKDRDKDWIYVYKLSALQKTLYKLFTVSYRILTVAGLLLIIFLKPYFNYYYESAVIAGCVIWICRTLLYFYCWWNCDFNNSDDSSDEVNYETATGENGGRTLNEREINEIVRKIADRWSYKDDSVLESYEGGGRVRYKVSVVIKGGTFIQYTINGKLSGVREEKLSTARSNAGYKMDKAAYKITEETKNELAKHNLPYSYEIQVIKGYIE